MPAVADSRGSSFSVSPQISQIVQFAGANLLFLGMAWVGVWAAYDYTVAWDRFLQLALAVLLVISVVRAGADEETVAFLGACCAVLAGAVGAYLLLVQDWLAFHQADFVIVPSLGQWLQDHRPTEWPLRPIHRNAAAAALAVVIPLGMVGVYGRWRQRRWVAVAFAVAGLLLGVAALVLSSSRGAWLGLGAGCIVAGIYWQLLRGAQRQETGSPSWHWLFLALLGSVPLLVLLIVHPLSLVMELPLLTALQSADPMVFGRLGIWRNMLTLVQDYPFTGSGLGSTEMVYSTYVLLIHVGYFTHAHNLFLQIAVEQGLPGLLAFVWLIGLGVAAVTRQRRVEGKQMPYPLAVLASFTALLVHGAFDSELYVSELAPLVLLPVGIALVVDRTLSKREPWDRPRARRSNARRVVVFALPSLLLAFAVILPAPLASYHANLGAVSQTRAELGVYRWPQWPIQDALRRSPKVDLGEAVNYYGQALALQPNHVTANRRLGQIALSQGNYATACQHLETANRASLHQHVTKRLLGECYAVRGDVEKAAHVWRQAQASRDQLKTREWWYRFINEDGLATRLEISASLSQP